MTVYCPKCGSARLHPADNPVKIDEEVDQVLYRQYEKCYSCGHFWADKWWEVWTPDGIETVTVNEDGSLGKRERKQARQQAGEEDGG